jgi:RimJ/RimL family protein N-acetyltransferase
MKIAKLKTDRLILRQWHDKDLMPFAALNADLKVMEYYPDILSESASNAMAKKLRGVIDKKGWGLWAVEEQATGEFIGFVGLHEPSYHLSVTPCVEIGWRLASSHWGKGYASEAASIALEFAFTDLKLKAVYSFTSVINKKSEAVMMRLGMKNGHQNFEHPMLPEGDPLREHVLYKIEWQFFNAHQTGEITYS